MSAVSFHRFVSMLMHALMYHVDTSVCVGLTTNWLEMSVVSVIVNTVLLFSCGKTLV